MKTMLLTAATAVIALAGAASAQDFTLDPTYGEYELSAGFIPDPAELEITAGGTLDASVLGGECAGSIADAPDVRLQWGGGTITLGAYSDVDTTLIVNGPDGEFYCADDVNDLDPAITFFEAGQYDIWVGVYGGGTHPATVYATEL